METQDIQSDASTLRVIFALLLCLSGASLAMLSFGGPAPSSSTTNAVGSPNSVPPANSSVKSPVIVTEFSDFQCPYCKRAANVIEQLRQTYGQRITIDFKQLPLPMHQYAFKAAQASVCAAEQGKFWQYHDRLFANDDLSVDQLNQIAARVGLEQTAFSDCMGSAVSRSVVQNDIAKANQLGVNGTPTFLVNSQVVKGGANFAVLQQAIDRAMAGNEPMALPGVQSADSRTRFGSAGVSNISSALFQKASLTQATSETDSAAEATKTTTSGLTLTPSSLDFGYQLVGMTGPQMVETVTNSNSTPVVIGEISVTGRNRTDFTATYGFTLPVRIPPGGSITINLTFAPAAPWRPGIRRGGLELTERHNPPQVIPLSGIGATCGGPVPACSSGCADTDGDGLNDAWEIAGGIDLNNDGFIDPHHDLLLSGADPNQPDIFVQYDWMDYGLPGNACNTDADCVLGLGHTGETCTGPQLIPTAIGSCRYACVTDSNCTSRGSSHAQEKCQNNSCVHTHDPTIVAPDALQAVVDQFAAHGINLHLIRGNALPHSTVLSFRLLSDPTNPLNVMVDSCEGGSVASGDAGLGKYAESFFDLKQQSSLDKLNVAYHYMVFGHYSGCDTGAHCNDNACASSCSYNPDGSPKACGLSGGQTGYAEISGNDFIVSFGSYQQDLGLTVGTISEAGTFMHELGHNLGLHHGGGIDNPCQDDSQCPPGVECVQTTVGKYCLLSDETNYKPNYLSVMNYRFQLTGIAQAIAVGSTIPISCSTDADCPNGNYCNGVGICRRVDFSLQTLPTGGNTPGRLDESNTNGHLGLNEPAGLGSGTADLTSFNDAMCDYGVPAATDGPVDWSGNGDTTETNVAADLNSIDHLCGTIFTVLGGSTDWPELSGINFNYNFQCTPFGGAGGDIAGRRDARVPGPYLRGGELSPYMALHADLLGDTP